jgi:hypothetical protein
VRSTGGLLRATALISGAALALHQLRYAFGYGLGSSEALEGHAYLPLAFTVAIGLLALAGMQFVVLVTRSQRPAAGVPRFRVVWLVMSGALLAIFVGQELLEGALAGGHGAVGLLAQGGWSAIPLALGLGAVIALALRGADRALRAAGRSGTPPARAPVALRPRRTRRVTPRASLLSTHLASRAPPVTS